MHDRRLPCYASYSNVTMDENRFYDFSNYDRNGEREYSENYLNRHPKKSANNKRKCSQSYYNSIVAQIENIKKRNEGTVRYERSWWRSVYRIESKPEMSDYEARMAIKKLEEHLRTLEVDRIDIGSSNKSFTRGSVRAGNKVTIKVLFNQRYVTYEILTEDKSDIVNNKISYLSPIAQGLMGHTVGEMVDVIVPRGLMKVEIISID